MKIDGMDASRVVISKTQDIRETNIDTKDTKDTEQVTNKLHLTNMEKQELPISEKVVIEAIEKANKAISGANRKFEFSIHEKTKEIMVKVIDSDSNEVIREIPPEKILDMVAKMWEMAGIMVDERR
ncbi:MAG: flagellar protein FlaG [Clostridia bacterium]|nr:flagellar protein FlaG [Clostridia bacterium]